MYRTLTLCVSAILVASFVSGVVIKREPFKRVIPADRLRDFPGMCFASTQCKVYGVDESWSLAPFCGRASCRLIETKDPKTDADRKFLTETVEDCGPLIDLEATAGCELLTVEDQADLEFPDCCPQYDCAEGTEIVYVNANATTPATR